MASAPARKPPFAGACFWALSPAISDLTCLLGSSPKIDENVTEERFDSAGFSFGSHHVPSDDHGPSNGVLLPSVRTSETKVGWSPNAVQKVMTCAFAAAARLAALPTVLSPCVNESCSTTLPPSCWKRTENALHTFLKYTSRLSVTTTADFQCIFLTANSAIAAPSS